MALVNKYVDIRIVVKDRGGNTRPIIFKTTATTALTAQSLLDTAVTAVEALSKAKVISATYTLGQVENDISIDQTNGEVEEKAEISVLLEQSASGPGQDKYGTISIPAPVDGLFQALSGELYNVVDPDNAALQTLLAEYLGGLGILGAFALSDYQHIQDPTIPGNVTGKRFHKGSRKG